MHIALIGASGNAGSRILQELSYRGHDVSAIARHPHVIPTLAHVTPIKGDVNAPDTLADILHGHDVVISAVHFTDFTPDTLLDAVRKAAIMRYLVVGGAGSLDDGSGKRLIDNPDFPSEYRQEAERGAAFLDLLQETADDLEWTFLSPSALFTAGERTGNFRLGQDTLISREDGSSISFEDFAIAMADEVEEPKHVRMRFTVGY